MTATRLDRLLFRFCDRLPCRIIADEGRVYLERYYLGRVFGWTFYLHRFVGPDPAGALHDHPWPLAISLVLTGGYEEWRGSPAEMVTLDISTRQITPGAINVIRGSDFHRVQRLLQGSAFTLFAHRPHERGWGFLTQGQLTRDAAVRPIAVYDAATERHGASFGAPWWRTAPKGRDAPRRMPLVIAP